MRPVWVSGIPGRQCRRSPADRPYCEGKDAGPVLGPSAHVAESTARLRRDDPHPVVGDPQRDSAGRHVHARLDRVRVPDDVGQRLPGSRYDLRAQSIRDAAVDQAGHAQRRTLDANPVIATANGVSLVDGKIRVASICDEPDAALRALREP